VVSPTAQTSLALLPQTPQKTVAVPVETADQEVPSQCAAAPSPPTAQMSVAPGPQMANRFDVVPLGVLDQACPFQCSITPLNPTAQMSLALLPQIAASPIVVPEGTLVQPAAPPPQELQAIAKAIKGPVFTFTFMDGSSLYWTLRNGTIELQQA
jgi:hypothetical protein